MSDGNAVAGAGDPYGTSNGQSHKVETAKHEAVDLKNTTTDAAKDVAGTAKDEAASVAHETKVQLKSLFDQTRRELGDQAATQKARLATGLGAVGSELGSMARNSDGSGLAADLVQRVSDRVSGAATWLGDRDPAGVVAEVRGFARRRPVVFIAGAALAGVVVGRLTRALAANAGDASASQPNVPARNALTAGAPLQPAAAVDAPLYAESAARFDSTDPGVPRERSDAF